MSVHWQTSSPCMCGQHTYILTYTTEQALLHVHGLQVQIEAQSNLCTLTLMGTKKEDDFPTRLQRVVRGEARKQRSAVDSHGVGRCGSPLLPPSNRWAPHTGTHTHTPLITPLHAWGFSANPPSDVLHGYTHTNTLKNTRSYINSPHGPLPPPQALLYQGLGISRGGTRILRTRRQGQKILAANKI